jgi:hypothetical protein
MERSRLLQPNGAKCASQGNRRWNRSNESTKLKRGEITEEILGYFAPLGTKEYNARPRQNRRATLLSARWFRK